MKRKNKILKKLKKYITTEPKGNFWAYAFLYLFLFSFITPGVVKFLPVFQLGLLNSNDELNPDFEKIGARLADTFMVLLEKLFDSATTIAVKNPTIAFVLFHQLLNVI